MRICICLYLPAFFRFLVSLCCRWFRRSSLAHLCFLVCKLRSSGATSYSSFVRLSTPQELVYVKVELATAEQRRHEDIDAFKRKLQAVKETVVAYAAASSSSLQVYTHCIPLLGRQFLWTL